MNLKNNVLLKTSAILLFKAIFKNSVGNVALFKGTLLGVPLVRVLSIL